MEKEAAIIWKKFEEGIAQKLQCGFFKHIASLFEFRPPYNNTPYG
jgi:hypothetical protein